MTPKMNFFDMVDEYCTSNLIDEDRLKFENELKQNPELKKEVEFEKDLQNAITEKDVLVLRQKLKVIEKQGPRHNGYFELFEGFTNIKQLSLALPPEELLDFYDSLPKVHIYQHGLNSNETIHQFYKEQDSADSEDDVWGDNFDDLEMEGLDEAILEKDIMDLRNTLSKVSGLVNLQYSSEEIEKYVEGNISSEEKELFEVELAINNNLKGEVEIYREVNKAIKELDIVNLRTKLIHLMETETSWNVSEQEIEEYIDGVLKGESLKEFEAELNENTDLKFEVALRRNVNKAIGEKDIISFKDKIREAKKNTETKELKSIMPDEKVHKMQWWRAGVAIAILFFAISGLFQLGNVNMDKMYHNYYKSPEWSPHRSVSTGKDHLYEANMYFSKGEYNTAIQLYDKAIKENDEKFVFHFYKAASLQNLERFEEAIPEYIKVITHGDNIFIEEAQWYKSLCYLRLNRYNKAKEELVAIIDRKGYYANDAKAVLRRLRYSYD